jgi:hypothetical protein
MKDDVPRQNREKHAVNILVVGEIFSPRYIGSVVLFHVCTLLPLQHKNGFYKSAIGISCPVGFPRTGTPKENLFAEMRRSELPGDGRVFHAHLQSLQT